MKLRPSIIVSLLVALILVGMASYWRLKHGALNPPLDLKRDSTQSTAGEESTEYHMHSRLLVFLDGVHFDLSQLHYMERAEPAHFHDNDGTIIHIHSPGITLPQMFKSLDMELTKDCFTTDKGRAYCTNATSTLSILINKKIYTEDIETYELKNYDKILINYGTDTPLDLQLKMNSLDNLGEKY